MSWSNESSRHSLASRGIRTRAIYNPIADPEIYDVGFYEHHRGEKRDYKGSGLEDIDAIDVVMAARAFIDEVIVLSRFHYKTIDKTIQEFNEFKRIRYASEMGLGDYWEAYNELVYSIAMAIIASYQPRIKSIYLKGSRVTGFYTSESDLDVIIQLDLPENLLDDIIEIGSVERWKWITKPKEVLYDEIEVLDEIVGSTIVFDFEPHNRLAEEINGMHFDVVDVRYSKPEGVILKIWEAP